jgi:hypothetical protein
MNVGELFPSTNPGQMFVQFILFDYAN